MKLLSPVKIGNLELKNRMIMAAMGPELGDFDRRTNDYYIRRAQGGASMIMTNVIATEDYDGPSPSSMITEESFEGYKELADSCHQYDCKLCLQIMPGVGLGLKAEDRKHPASASRTPISHDSDILFDELSKEEIKHIQAESLKTARLAVKAGADAIEIHAYGGYLTDRFMTKRWNIRTDEYGGSLENRMRFLIEIIDDFQEEFGKDFPLIVKFTPDHMLDPEYGYRSMDEGIKIAKILEELGVHALHIDVGCHDNWHLAMPPIYQQEAAPQLLASQKIKEVSNLPIISNGRLGDPGKAESSLNDGYLDALAIGRQFLADPFFPKKIMENRSDEIRYCIYCNEGCIKSVSEGRVIDCAVNPVTGLEGHREIKKTKSPKKILVIGGGPGGSSAAIYASQAGHKVELWEKEAYLGGNFYNACMPSFKRDGNKILSYYKTMLDKLGVEIKFNKTATKENILDFGADLVINASGGSPLRPNFIKGIDRPNVGLATDVLQNRYPLGDNILIVGAGLVGCETALVLDSQGKNVTVVEMADEILPEAIWIQNSLMLRSMLDESSINFSVASKLLEIAEDHVLIEKDTGLEKITCDNVVLAMGFRPNNEIYEELKEDINIVNIGDSIAARKVIDAVGEAYNLIYELD